MKKIFALLFMIALSFTLFACTGGDTCTEHTDADGNLKCDNCDATLECTAHVDSDLTDENSVCDLCGAPIACNEHVDVAPKNLVCDVCGKILTCSTHSDKNGDSRCDLCGATIPCNQHVDMNSDSECDKCRISVNCEHADKDHENNVCNTCNFILPCSVHNDVDENLKCDRCNEDLECINHVDVNPRDLKCDKCGTDVECTHPDENKDGICDICTYVTCEHTYDMDIWYSDQTSHWHNVTCGCNVSNKDFTLHDDADNNGICDTCEYVLCSHTFDELRWVGDETGHWHPATCEHSAAKSEIQPHKLDEEGFVCTECNYLTNHEHTYDTDKWVPSQTEHWHAASCEHTSKKIDVALHDDADNDGICNTCSYKFCEHTPNTDWNYDTKNHWHDPSCDHDVDPTDKAAHIDETRDGYCDVCNFQVCTHTYKWVNTDPEKHWLVPTCGCDLTAKDEGDHVDENGDILCDVCSYNYGHEHQFNTSNWITDETHHWHVATCEHSAVKGSYAMHTDIDGNFKCDVCQCPYEDLEVPNIPDSDGTVIVTPPHYIGGNKPKDEE